MRGVGLRPCCACACSASSSSRSTTRRLAPPAGRRRARAARVARAATRACTRARRSPVASGPTCSTRARARACAPPSRRCARRSATERRSSRATRDRVGFARDAEVWVDARAFEELCRDGDARGGAGPAARRAARRPRRRLGLRGARAPARAPRRRAGARSLAPPRTPASSSRALGLTRERVAADPLSEAAHRELIRRLAASGDRGAALFAYSRLQQRLRDELRVAPSAQTRALVERIRTSGAGDGLRARRTRRQGPRPARLPSPARAHTAQRVRRSRAEHRGGCAAAWEQRARGRAAASCSSPGSRGSARRACSPSSGEPSPAARRRGALRALQRGDADPLPAVRRGARRLRCGRRPVAADRRAPAHRRRARTAASAAWPPPFRRHPRSTIRPGRATGCSRPWPRCCARGRRTLAAAAGRWTTCTGPTGRPCSCSAISRRMPAPARVLIAGAYRETELARSHPLAHALADLRRDRLVERVALRGLGRTRGGGARRRERSGVAGDPAPASRSVHQETGGNPFFVEEIASHLAETGGRERSGIPEGVQGGRSATASTASRPATDELLRLAAGGRAGTSTSPCSTRSRPAAEDALLDALDEAVASGLVREASERAGTLRVRPRDHPRHPLRRADPHARRVRLHGRVADALEALPGDADGQRLAELAHHLFQAAPGGAATARRPVRLAGPPSSRPRQLAWEEAAAHYERARRGARARGPGETPSSAGELLARLGEARMRAGERVGGPRGVRRVRRARQAARRRRRTGTGRARLRGRGRPGLRRRSPTPSPCSSAALGRRLAGPRLRARLLATTRRSSATTTPTRPRARR